MKTDGTNDVYVWTDAADVGNYSKGKVISTRRGETFNVTATPAGSKQVKLYVGTNGFSSNIDVTAYGQATIREDGKNKVVRLSESKVAKATFKASSDLGTSHTGIVEAFDKDKKKLKFENKKELNYKEEFDANKVLYEDARTSTTLKLNFAQFEDIVSTSPNAKLHYYKNNDGVITFTILEATSAAEQTQQAVDAEAAKITSITAPAQDATSLDLPVVPEGFTVAIKSSSDEAVIDTDGNITPPDAATTVTLVLTVSKDGKTADTQSIDVVVPAKSVTPPVLSDDTELTVTVGEEAVVTDITGTVLTVATGTTAAELVAALTAPANASFELQDTNGDEVTGATVVDNTMTVVVTAEDGTEETYTIVIA